MNAARSFRDGLILAALTDSLRPGVLDMEAIKAVGLPAGACGRSPLEG